VIARRHPASARHIHCRDRFLFPATPSKSALSKTARHRDAVSGYPTRIAVQSERNEAKDPSASAAPVSPLECAVTKCDTLTPLSSALTKTAGCHYAAVSKLPASIVRNPSPLTPISSCFQQPTHSFALAQKPTLSFSMRCALFAKNTGGGGCLLASLFITSLPPYVHTSAPQVPLHRSPCGARMDKLVAQVLETTPPPPVSNKGERTSGSASARRRPRFTIPGPLGSKVPATESQVVPGFVVLSKRGSYRVPETADRIAGWLASQRRAGKAGSVRLG